MSELLYVPMIDSIIATHESLEKLKPKLIFNQLQAFLNRTFTSDQRHNLKKLIKTRISKLQNQRKKDDEYLIIAKENQLKCFTDLIIDKIRSQIWKDLLYTQNQQDSTIADDKIEETVEDTAPNTTENTPSSLENPTNTRNQISTLYRKNMTLMYQLDHELNPFNLAPTTKNFIKCRQLEAKRKRTKTFYKNYEDTLKVKSAIDSKKLFTWSSDIQNLLNIKDPLTTPEVLYLTHRYLKEHNLFKNSTFHPDNKTLFLGPDSCKFSMTKLFKILESHTQSSVGTLFPDNSRVLKQRPDIFIPTDNYNITQQLWDDKTTEFLQNVDILEEFHALYKTYNRKTIKKKKNA